MFMFEVGGDVPVVDIDVRVTASEIKAGVTAVPLTISVWQAHSVKRM